jgi:hypothetical protein
MDPESAETDVDWALAKMSKEFDGHKKMLAGEKLGVLSGASQKVENKFK